MTIAKQSRSRNSRITPSLLLGIGLVIFIVLVGVIGPMFVDAKKARVGAVEPNLSPTATSWFGSDSQGRDVFTTTILAVPPTLRIGLIAGLISVTLGLILGLLAGFFPGWPDGLIRTFSDVLMAVPSIAFMILVVARMARPDIIIVAIITGFLTWPGTARGIRSQVLSIRERSYTLVARANGETELGVLFREVMPNLLPLMLASFIGAVTSGIYTVMALEVLGLGSTVIPTLGMMVFWSQRFAAVLRGMWWWWGPPILVLALIFLGLFLLSRGLDRYVNPSIPTTRHRRRPRLKPEAQRAAAAEQAAAAAADGAFALQVKNLQVIYETPAGVVKAVDDVSFTLRPGERMGLIGESGCGKTTMATALMSLSRPPARITAGQILLQGRDLLSLNEEALQNLRLKEIALIPQASMNSLNPVMRIGVQVRDGLKAHMGQLSNQELDQRVAEALQRVGLRPEVSDRYPHQLSGGMRQRVAMAIANALAPKVIIADEPTSALDVVIQKQVMLTLSRLQQEQNAAVLLIGHDMGLIAQFAEKIGVLYAGKLVEVGSVQDVLDNPLHPYTRMLITCLPTMDGKRDLVGISGLPPQLLHLPPGCTFHPRCPFASERCKSEAPVLQESVDHRQVSCHLYPEHVALPPVPVKANTLEA